MILFIMQEGAAGVGDPYQVVGKIRKKILQKEPSRQVLQPFMRMRHIPVQGHIIFEEFFGLLDLPDPQPGEIVNLLLIKNGQRTDFRVKIAGIDKYEIIYRIYKLTN